MYAELFLAKLPTDWNCPLDRHLPHLFTRMPAPPPPAPLRVESHLQSVGTSVIEDPVHHGIECASCHTFPVIGTRYHCVSCPGGADFCGICEDRGLSLLLSNDLNHYEAHVMIKFNLPVDRNVVGAVAASLNNAAKRLNDQAQGRMPHISHQAVHEQSISHAPRSNPTGTRNTTWPQASIPTQIVTACCSECGKDLSGGPRYLCARCPFTESSSGQVGYSLCQACETKSLLLHDPSHFFVKIARSRSSAPFASHLVGSPSLLPSLYESNQLIGRNSPPKQQANVPSGFRAWLGRSSSQEIELRSLREASRVQENSLVPIHNLVHPWILCDSCFEVIEGAWLRCCNCTTSYDLCSRCEFRIAHDNTHVFAVFKQPVDVALFKSLVDHGEDRAGAARPMLDSTIFAV